MTDATEGEVLTPEAAEAEHDRLFAERAAEIDAKRMGEAPPVAAPAAEPAREELKDASEPAKEPAKDDTKPLESAAKTEGSEQQEAAKEPAKEDDLLKDLPEDRRAAIAARLKAAQDAENKAKGDVRSMAGRVSAYERKYQEAIGRKPADAAKAASKEEVAEWTQFKTDYPDIAAGIEAKEKATRANSATDATVEQLATYVREEQQKRFLNDAWTAVDAVHEGFRDVVVTPEFKAWQASSPTYEKLASSDDIEDAIALMDLWTAHHPSNAAPAGPTPEATAAANKLAARRTAQAAGAKSPASTGATPNQDVDPNDEEQIFNFYAAKANERLRKRGF